MVRISSLILLVLCTLSQFTFAQEVPADTLAVDEQFWDDEPDDEIEPEPEPEIQPLSRTYPVGFTKTLTDSTLRWEQWMNPGEWYHNRSGMFTYRLGMFGRNDAIHIRGRDDSHRKMTFEGILMNNRVSGSMNTNVMPWHRIESVYEQDHGTLHHSDFTVRDYYVIRPLTFINTEISADNYRNTEVMLTRNLGRRTNVELSWWDKQSSPGYSRNLLEGNQFNMKVYHHLNTQWILRGGLMRNNLSMNEPGGFQIPDMRAFSFLGGSTSAIIPNANSSQTDLLAYSSLLYRSDEFTPSNSRMTIYYSDQKRNFFSADTVRTLARTAGLQTDHNISISFLDVGLNGGIEYTTLPKSGNTNIATTDWISFHTHPSVMVNLGDFATIGGTGYLWQRNYLSGFYENSLETDLSLLAQIRPIRQLQIQGSISFGNQPLHLWGLYHLYNPQNEFIYTGSDTEKITRTEISTIYSYGSIFQIEATGWQSDHRDVHSFTGVQGYALHNYETVGFDAGFSFDTATFEGGFSATYQQSNFELSPDDQLWLRGNLYYKSYIYDRAAFMKLGIKGILSPFSYRTPRHFPEQDIWGYNILAESSQIPAFQRIDLNASIRVRSAIFLLQYENILGGFNIFVPSYFETADYPMFPSRFRFGVRWLLRN